MLMEKPDTSNVSRLDEYPHLEEKLRAQRRGQPAVRGAKVDFEFLRRLGHAQGNPFYKEPEPPDDAA